jgi:hypothetical protein
MPIDTNVWSAGPSWYHQLLQWDSEWYFRIVTEGYGYNGDPTIPQNIVFYPLYPMLARGLAATSGISAPDTLLLVANISGFCAIVLLFKLVREEFGDDLALATVALLSFIPTSVFLSAGYTEPLELLLVVSFFLTLKLPYLTLSGGSAGFVSMSRFNLVSFPLFVVMADVGLRAKWLLIGVIGLFSAALFMNAALFARRIWIG